MLTFILYLTTATVSVPRDFNIMTPYQLSLGEVSSSALVYEDSTLKLKYRGADLCPETGQPYLSIITFLCDAEDNVVSFVRSFSDVNSQRY